MKVNAEVASKVIESEGRARIRRAKAAWVAESDRYGYLTSAGWKRQHGGKDMPSNWRSPPRPGEKSPEQGRSYNRLNREIDRRREGGGWVRMSDEAEVMSAEQRGPSVCNFSIIRKARTR